MMSEAAIREMQREAAEAAAAKGALPFVFFSEEEVDVRAVRRSIPFLGDYIPEGWEQIDAGRQPELFVDTSGFGAPWEAALTVDEFLDEVRRIRRQWVDRGETVGFAVTEAGQFQAYVGVFRRLRQR